ncbi:Transcriptional repressor NrdR [Aedoeadaptatus ivorii]|uniref:Transcriptional repressor NrdR n=1 Tax=Aedoeadaptatus ivorii TaxID=54006 RepID=A0A448V1S1_9FIRM|nr:transcriptional regulator NrdR [Peptoniphilus ivorii]MDQ0508934.1 transcriptional repressor NrdR [Peptoniphilus ivorii]VEJ35760.1 Transcriptional repressor NrdR [Peptoniphilus ivorii]
MRCPYCQHSESKVVDSRPTDEGTSIRRRRECLGCNKRFTTYEQVEVVPITVLKKSGGTEVFDRNKILNGLIKSCEKRSVSVEDMEAIADDIESTLQSNMIRQITSEEIGEMILARLKDLDEVAYVRFASVYRRFQDIDSFMQELKALQNKKE